MDSDRTAYEREALEAITAPFRRKPSLSDSDRASEYALQMELCHLVSLMRDCIKLVNVSSSLVSIDEKAWEEFVHDELPNNLAWDEKINNARRGWDQ